MSMFVTTSLRILKSPAGALALLTLAGLLAAVGVRAAGTVFIVALAAAARLAWLSQSLGKYQSITDWLAGHEPPKSKLQVIGELMSEFFARNPPAPYLSQLRVVVRECADPLSVDVELHNAGTTDLHEVSAKVTDLLYPDVNSWDQWNHGGGRPTDLVADFLQPVTIAILTPGQSAVVRRKLFPHVLPISQIIRVDATVDSKHSNYRVQATVSSNIGIMRCE